MFEDSIPNVEHLRSQTPVIALRRFVGQSLTNSDLAYALVLNSVRLADQAVREFDLARTAVLAPTLSVAAIDVTSTLRATGHLEASLSSLERFLKHVKAIRSTTELPRRLKDTLPRSTVLLTSDVERRLTRFRHAIAHTEGELLKGSIQTHSSPFLLTGPTGISLGDHSISWVELVAWLSEAHSLSSSLARYTEA